MLDRTRPRNPWEEVRDERIPKAPGVSRCARCGCDLMVRYSQTEFGPLAPTGDVFTQISDRCRRR
jgi:hypothetical protein